MYLNARHFSMMLHASMPPASVWEKKFWVELQITFQILPFKFATGKVVFFQYLAIKGTVHFHKALQMLRVLKYFVLEAQKVLCCWQAASFFKLVCIVNSSGATSSVASLGCIHHTDQSWLATTGRVSRQHSCLLCSFKLVLALNGRDNRHL